MSSKLDILIDERKKIIIALYFLIIISSIVGMSIYYFGFTRLSKTTYNIVFRTWTYGFQLLIFYYLYKLFKTSKTIGKDNTLKMQFNDERMKIIRLKSMARGFKVMMYTSIESFFIYTLLSLFIIDPETIYGLPEVPIALLSVFFLCFIGFTTAFVSYFTLDS